MFDYNKALVMLLNSEIPSNSISRGKFLLGFSKMEECM